MFRAEKKLLLLAFITISVGSAAKTQFYYTGVGVRFGKFNSGISFKHFYNTDNATAIQVDASITHIADGGYTLKGFYLRQIPFRMPVWRLPLDFIYGFGVHGGYFGFDEKGYYKIRNGNAIFYGKKVFTAGIDGTVQVEYQVNRRKIPLSFTVDCIPFYEFYNPGPEFIDFGISVRYTFR